MRLINFTHPLTPEQIDDLTAKTQVPMQVIDAPAQFDPALPYPAQARALANQIPLSGEEWQTTPLLINLPGHSAIAACLLAELHGRMGHFPSVVRLRPMQNTSAPKFEFAEIINLQALRDQARKRR